MLALSSLSLKHRHFLSLTSLIFKQNPNPNFQFHTLRFFSSSSDQSWLSVPGKPLISWPREPCAPPNPQPDPNPNPNPSPGAEFSQNEFAAISELLKNPNISGGLSLHTALDRTGIEPSPTLLQAVFDHFDSSPNLLYSLFLWAEKQPGFGASASLFSSVINVLAKSREFDSAWSLILDRIGKPEELTLEGHLRAASDYFDKKRKLEPSLIPSIRVYNILLNGWFRSRKLKQAERLWMEMKRENVKATVVTYGTLAEGYCRMRRAERAIELVNEMRKEGIEPNAIVGIIPTPTTYNYFFKYFSKFGKVEEGMNLYTKMIESGHSPDRLTYQLLLKMLCEDGKLDLAVQVSKEMRSRGYDMDLATSTMLIHLLCNMHRLKEACAEFEDMIRRGIVPQYLTYQRMNDELKKQGMTEMVWRLSDLMSSVPHSTRLPNTYNRDGDASRARRNSIIRKAEAMSEMLKSCTDPRELVRYRGSFENAVSLANRLIDDIQKKN
ncbi:hypothetical protein TIFTF001_014426 [Ficus carica]|uniref:Pentatricopeptide repeat-containing protein n=1 Tax=Ficus carica TaxID=3494 RepID=A0AA87ZWS7_FICCA|nr:hypothetical protein TIFTF001_014426 [Ficus carica]